MSLSDESLDRLGVMVALASAPGFLWRHLSRDMAIEELSRTTTPQELATQLEEVLRQDQPEGRELTLAYCLLVAWLLKGPSAAHDAGRIPNIDRLPLAAGLIDRRASQSSSSTLTLELPRTPVVPLRDQRLSGTANSTSRSIEPLPAPSLSPESAESKTENSTTARTVKGEVKT